MGSDSTPLEDREREQRLRALCEEAGFPLAQIRREGEVLVLVPETLASLPSADTLQALSARIRHLGYRYVTFSVEAEGSLGHD